MIASWPWGHELTLILTKRDFFGASLCEDFSDLTSPTSNHYIKLFVVYNTL